MYNNQNQGDSFLKSLEGLWSNNANHLTASILYNFYKSQGIEQQILNLAVEKEFMALIRQGKVDADFAYASIDTKLQAIDAAIARETTPDSKVAIVGSLALGFISAIPASMPMFLGSLSTAPAYNAILGNQEIAKQLANSFPVAIFTALGLMTVFLSSEPKKSCEVVTRLLKSLSGKSVDNQSIAIIMCTLLGAVTTGYMAVVSSTAAHNAASGVLDYLSTELGFGTPSDKLKVDASEIFRICSLLANGLLGLPSNVDAFLRLSTDLRGLSFCHQGITPRALLSLINYWVTFALVAATSCWGYLPSAGYGPTSPPSTLVTAIVKNFGNISIFSSKLAAMLERLLTRQSSLVSKPSIGCAFISLITLVLTFFLTMAFVGYGLIQQPNPGNHNNSSMLWLGDTNSSTPLYPRQGLAGLSVDAYVGTTLAITFPILFSMIFGAMDDVSTKLGTFCRSPRELAPRSSVPLYDDDDPLLSEV